MVFGAGSTTSRGARIRTFGSAISAARLGCRGRFISVTQVGDAAAVQLSWDLDKFAGYIDFHNLLRINGVWKITNKTATHSSR